MHKIGNGHRTAIFSLLTAGSMVLLGLQQLTTTAALARSESLVDGSASQPTAVTLTAAGLPVGDFEPLIKPTPAPTPAPAPEAAPVVDELAFAPIVPPAPPKPVVFESGIASTYGEGDGFEGNLTACGQVFHTSVVQIAHKSLPCGTRVRVEDTDTGRAVDAEVTDRGPYVPGRIVDLSWGAFKQLDPTGPGLLHVNVYVLEK